MRANVGVRDAWEILYGARPEGFLRSKGHRGVTKSDEKASCG